MKEMNMIIRSAQRKKRMYNYEIARLLGISEITFSRWMREEMPEAKQKEIADMILKSKGE